MASTFNLFLKLIGILGAEVVEIGSLSSPYNITTSSDVKADKIVTCSSGTTITLLTVGSGEDITSMVGAVILPSVAGNLVITGATAADNSAITCVANVPVILPSGNTLPYQSTASNRIDETAAAITSIAFRNTSVSSGTIRIIAVG